MVESTEQIADVTAALEATTEVVRRITEIMNRHAPEFKGTGSSRQLAAEIEPCADAIEVRVAEYRGALDGSTPYVIGLLDLAIESKDPSAGAGLASSVIRSSEGMDEMIASYVGAIDAIRSTENLSRDFRRPSVRIRRAFQQVVDSRSVLSDWASKAEHLLALAEVELPTLI